MPYTDLNFLNEPLTRADHLFDGSLPTRTDVVDGYMTGIHKPGFALTVSVYQTQNGRWHGVVQLRPKVLVQLHFDAKAGDKDTPYAVIEALELATVEKVVSAVEAVVELMALAKTKLPASVKAAYL